MSHSLADIIKTVHRHKGNCVIVVHRGEVASIYGENLHKQELVFGYNSEKSVYIYLYGEDKKMLLPENDIARIFCSAKYVSITLENNLIVYDRVPVAGVNADKGCIYLIHPINLSKPIGTYSVIVSG